jgi:choline kinase
MEEHPDLIYIYNPEFDRTNTSKSLLRALYKCDGESVLWLNGDVVFDSSILELLNKYIEEDKSFVAVNNSSVGEEEVKYSIGDNSYIKEISKQVENAPGEAVGINFISSTDRDIFIRRLEECDSSDYFEKGLEMAIEKDNINIMPVDISDFKCIEVDFREDLDQANKLF